MINKLQDLERDLLFFYDYLLFLKESESEDTWLNYVSVYLKSLEVLYNNDLEIYKNPKRFTKKNYVKNYMKLSKMFELSEFEGVVLAIEDIRLVRNRWRLF